MELPSLESKILHSKKGDCPWLFLPKSHAFQGDSLSIVPIPDLRCHVASVQIRSSCSSCIGFKMSLLYHNIVTTLSNKFSEWAGQFECDGVWWAECGLCLWDIDDQWDGNGCDL